MGIKNGSKNISKKLHTYNIESPILFENEQNLLSRVLIKFSTESNEPCQTESFEPLFELAHREIKR